MQNSRSKRYVFRAMRADRLKMIWWDGTGLVMAYKRLEQNAFKWPAIRDGVLWQEAWQVQIVSNATRRPAA
ncbi:IS66 family insertion sequence element accessory protein TnpB [Shimia sp.]|uniref:IS66 family insertion sequence element accessory protein TnpB n=1 Tax=Shimia sp. TaxID=1954381 RepID=UPI0032981A5E